MVKFQVESNSDAWIADSVSDFCVVCCTFQPSTGIWKTPCFTRWQMIIIQSCFASNSLVIFTAINISNKHTPRFRFTLTLRLSIIMDFRLTQTARVKRCERAPFPIPGRGIYNLWSERLVNMTNPYKSSKICLNYAWNGLARPTSIANTVSLLATSIDSTHPLQAMCIRQLHTFMHTTAAALISMQTWMRMQMQCATGYVCAL